MRSLVHPTTVSPKILIAIRDVPDLNCKFPRVKRLKRLKTFGCQCFHRNEFRRGSEIRKLSVPDCSSGNRNYFLRQEFQSSPQRTSSAIDRISFIENFIGRQPHFLHRLSANISSQRIHGGGEKRPPESGNNPTPPTRAASLL